MMADLALVQLKLIGRAQEDHQQLRMFARLIEEMALHFMLLSNETMEMFMITMDDQVLELLRVSMSVQIMIAIHSLQLNESKNEVMESVILGKNETMEIHSVLMDETPTVNLKLVTFALVGHQQHLTPVLKIHSCQQQHSILLHLIV